ncbi:Ti-type conjugative transfer relaxase TraA [soil metagenome]
MAIYRIELKPVSRSEGRSVVAAAAYRSASKILDERTGITHDFTKKKHDLMHQEILLPKNAPAWMAVRKELWNKTEALEKRHDAQLARECQITLPLELTPEQNIALVREFVQTEFVNRGMVADICLHRGHKGGEEQPHAHVLLSLRGIKGDSFGNKERAWNDKALLLNWREAWANTCNRHLALAGLDIRIDHRSLADQGINLEPQIKLGPKAAKIRLAKLEEYKAIAKRNGERLLRNPEIALDAITRQQSTFTHQDIARFINRYTVDAEQFGQVYQLVKSHSSVISLGRDKKGNERFTTAKMLALEKHMLEQAKSKAATNYQALPATTTLPALTASGHALTTDQQLALQHILFGKDLSCVVGFAGSGKSTMLEVARQVWEKAGYQVLGMSLSGIAAENLQASSGIASQTVARTTLQWDNKRNTLSKNHIVIVDEAGMLGSRQLARIIDEVQQAGAKLVLIGDAEQLQAIEAGAAFRALVEHLGAVELVTIHRQKEVWQQQATRDLAQTRTVNAIDAYKTNGHLHAFDNQETAIKGLLERWEKMRRDAPEETQLLLAFTRKEVRTLNELARAIRHQNGELGQDHFFVTERGNRNFAVGDRIYFLQNDTGLGVKNGSLGTLEVIHGNTFTVRLDSQDKTIEGCRITFNLDDYAHIDHGYAATIHKAQGSTVDRTLVLASHYFDRHLTYVALTRHRQSVDIYWSEEAFKTEANLIKKLARENSKDITLDYTKRRGITPPSLKSEIKYRDVTQQTDQKNRVQTADIQQLLDIYRDFYHRWSEAVRLKVSNLVNDPTTAKIYSQQSIQIHKIIAKLTQELAERPEVKDFLAETNQPYAYRIRPENIKHLEQQRQKLGLNQSDADRLVSSIRQSVQQDRSYSRSHGRRL